MLVVESVGYFDGVNDVTRKICKSELIPGIYYVYDEYDDGSQVRVTYNGNIQMTLLEAAQLLEYVRQ